MQTVQSNAMLPQTAEARFDQLQKLRHSIIDRRSDLEHQVDDLEMQLHEIEAEISELYKQTQA